MNIFLKTGKESGEVSRTLIIIGVVVFVALLGLIFVFRLAAKNTEKKSEEEPVEEEKVYETTISEKRFLFESAKDLGNIIRDPRDIIGRDVVTTEKFILVTIGAQNKRKINTKAQEWQVGNIVDSEGRNFIPVTGKASHLFPKKDLCGAILKPEFAPTPCVKLYEVSKASTSLKIVVLAKNKEGKSEAQFLDLLVQ